MRLLLIVSAMALGAVLPASAQNAPAVDVAGGYSFLRDEGADVNLPDNTASVGFRVVPGRPARIGEVTIEGLGSELPEDRVRSALGIKPGDLYSQTDLEEAKRALLDLGVFGAVLIEPHPDKKDRPDRVPIRVRVEPSKLRSVHLGGGVGIDST